MNISCKLYVMLLRAYPPEFRYRFAGEMVQVFRDSYAHETSRRSLPGFWLWTLFDLIVSAAKERKEGMIMNRNVLGMLGCIAIIVVAFLLLHYGRKYEVASILAFGYILDALVVSGIIGNAIVFLLTKTTKMDPFRIALWTFATVHAALLLFIVLVISRVDPGFNVFVVIAYPVSFLIWTALHFVWRRRLSVYS